MPKKNNATSLWDHNSRKTSDPISKIYKDHLLIVSPGLMFVSQKESFLA